MQTLAKQVFEYATGLPEGTPLVAKELLYLPVEGRFGTRAPSAVKMVEGLANQRGETIVSHGAAANTLGLTTQVPMRAIYLTSGPSRRLYLVTRR
jgi:Family of unknown function (DUF6088)